MYEFWVTLEKLMVAVCVCVVEFLPVGGRPIC